MAYSPDGHIALTASGDGSICLWDATTGILRLSLAGHTSYVSAASFSPDGHKVLTASWDGTARLWDTATGALLATLSDPPTLNGPREGVNAASFSPDGTTIALARGKKTLLWSGDGLTRGPELSHADDVRQAVFSLDARLILTGSYDHAVKLWDAKTGKLFRTLVGHKEAITALSISPDGQTVLSAGYEGVARLWDATTGKLQFVLNGHSGPIRAALMSPDGKTLLTAGDDQTARLWSATAGSLLHTLARHARTVSVALFSPDGQTVLTGGEDGTTCLSEVQSGRLLKEIHGESPITAAVFAPGGRAVLVGTHDGNVRLWDVATGAPIANMIGHSDSVGATAVSPDGRTLVTSSRDGQVRIWDLPSGKVRLSALNGVWPISSAQFSPDGRTVLVSSSTATILLDSQTGVTRAVLSNGSASFSPDGRSVITKGPYETVAIWDSETGKLRFWLQGRHNDQITSAAFSPDGRRVLTGSRDSSAHLWDSHTGRLQKALSGRREWITAVAFSHEGNAFFTASGDGKARLWDAHTGRKVVTFEANREDIEIPTEPILCGDGRSFTPCAPDNAPRPTRPLILKWKEPSSYVGEPAFSPDDRSILTTGVGFGQRWNESARIWDVRTGKLKFVLRGHSEAVESAVFSPDGRVILTGSGDNSARIWSAQDGSRIEVIPAQQQREALLVPRPGLRLSDVRSPVDMIVVTVGEGVSLHTLDEQWHRRSTITLNAFQAADGRTDALLSTQNGLFTGDEGAFEKVVYRLGADVLRDDLVTADQLFERFHRSSLLSEFWSGSRLDLPSGLAGGVGRPPHVSIVSLPRITTSPRVHMKLEAADRGGGVGEIRVYVNGARVGYQFAPGARPDSGLIDQSGQEAPRGPGVHDIELALVPGDNFVSVEAYNLLGELRGPRAQQVIRLDARGTKERLLHMLAVSIGQYADPTLRLAFTRADAASIASAFRRQEGRLFARVDVIDILDGKATRGELVRAFQKIAAHANPQDVFVLYVSSHGAVATCRGHSEYQVVLHGASRGDICADAMSVSDLTTLVETVPAHQKLILLDTCQSGSAVDGKVLEQLRGPLRDSGLRSARAAGVAIIAASASTQASFEAAEWRHGLFTVALLRGLEGRAAFEGDRTVSVSNLVRYVSRYVPILSERFVGAQQTPTFGMVGDDFTLAQIEKTDRLLIESVDDLSGESASRNVGALGGTALIVRNYIQLHRSELLQCAHGLPFDLTARWHAGGDATFSARGNAAGDVANACVNHALGSIHLGRSSADGESVTFVAP